MPLGRVSPAGALSRRQRQQAIARCCEKLDLHRENGLVVRQGRREHGYRYRCRLPVAGLVADAGARLGRRHAVRERAARQPPPVPGSVAPPRSRAQIG